MIVGLEFDADDDLVDLRTFTGAPAGREWMRTGMPRAHSRSLYEVTGQGFRAGAERERLVTHALRHGVLLMDRDSRARSA